MSLLDNIFGDIGGGLSGITNDIGTAVSSGDWASGSQAIVKDIQNATGNEIWGVLDTTPKGVQTVGAPGNQTSHATSGAAISPAIAIGAAAVLFILLSRK